MSLAEGLPQAGPAGRCCFAKLLEFDKSFLQSINVDESAWLDHFFACNITPLFFIETLADIEKEVHKGRTPEQIVGSLAEKTPDMQGLVNPFHLSLLESELMAGAKFGMDGRMLKAGGQVVQLIFYRADPEEEHENRRTWKSWTKARTSSMQLFTHVHRTNAG